MTDNNNFLIDTEPKFIQIDNETEIFNSAWENKVPLMLKGPTGSGKTRFIEHMAWKLKQPLITVSCHEDMTASDLVGRFLLEGSETVWKDGPLTRAVRYGGICYLEGSHILGTINHEMSFTKGSSQKIPEKLIPKLLFKKNYPKLKPGDCIIHHPEVIHGSKKNVSNKDRVGFVISYKAKNSKIDTNKLDLYKKKLKKNLKKIYS